jgi:alpha-L-fucosidase 2
MGNPMKITVTLLAVVTLLSCTASAETANELALRYNKPASIWEETLPLGNGRIGMMPDGGIDRELVVLNDITMWSGSEDPEAINPEAIGYLPKIRELLLAGKNGDAQRIMYEHFRCGGVGSSGGKSKNAPYGCFQMLGNLRINYQYPHQEAADNYQRKLSLNDAVASTSFTRGGITYNREYLASHSDDVLAIRVAADRRGAVSFELELSRPERATISVKGESLIMEGQLNDGHNGDKGVRYLTKVEIVNKGGTVSAGSKSLSLSNADEAIILISTSTDMLDKEYLATVDRLLERAKRFSFVKMKRAHTALYKEKFDRVELWLGEQDNSRTTDKRLAGFQTDDDPAFAALYFQYGRYLIICGTNERTLPLNLQGLWANQVQTPWNGDYHLNINVQMNYWPVEVCNLSELHQPLITFTQSLVPSGEATAKAFYGAEGWLAHMMSNPWKFTAPGEHASWGATNTGGAWLCAHLWEHFAFSQDKKYLRTIYPTLAGAAKFFLSGMIAEPKNGWLVTAPSSSPENGFYIPGDKDRIFVCMGPTMDVQLIKELFTNVLSAASILGIEDGTTARIRETLPKLPPMQISSSGYLQEWLEDYREADPQHRHVSHLYGLYPSNQISPNTTPELAAAARETLERRGDGGTGWSRAWKINFWARLQDGNRAYKLLKNLLEPTAGDEISMSSGAGTYANLFCAHPPFQIDGNLGGTAGIAEMLIQSQDGYIQLLPALPDRWASGSFKGLRVRGGAEVDASWKNSRLLSATLRAETGGTFRVKVPDHVTAVKRNGKRITVENGYIALELKKGQEARVEFIS